MSASDTSGGVEKVVKAVNETADDLSAKAKQSAQDAGQQAGAMADDAAEQAQAVADEASETAEGLTARAKRTAQQATQQAQAMAAEASEAASEGGAERGRAGALHRPANGLGRRSAARAVPDGGRPPPASSWTSWARRMRCGSRRRPRSRPWPARAESLAGGMERGGAYLEEQGASGLVEDLKGVVRRHPGPVLGVLLAVLAVIVLAGSRRNQA